MSKICLKNTNYTCVIAYRCNGQVGLLTHRRYSNPVSISGDKGIGISVDCVKTRETAPRLIGLKNCAYGLVISRYA